MSEKSDRLPKGNELPGPPKVDEIDVEKDGLLRNSDDGSGDETMNSELTVIEENAE